MVVVFFDVELMVKEVARVGEGRERETERERATRESGGESSNADREIKSSDFMSVKIKTKRKISFDPVLTVPCQQTGLRET